MTNDWDYNELAHRVDTILSEASDELNDWESTFINDIKIRIDNQWALSQAQVDKLYQIYERKILKEYKRSR